MLNEKQKQWVLKQQNRVNEYYINHNPMTDDDYEKVVDFVDEVTKKAKGNAEVRSEMLDILEKWEVKRINDERNRKQNIQ